MKRRTTLDKFIEYAGKSGDYPQAMLDFFFDITDGVCRKPAELRHIADLLTTRDAETGVGEWASSIDKSTAQEIEEHVCRWYENAGEGVRGFIDEIAKEHLVDLL